MIQQQLWLAQAGLGEAEAHLPNLKKLVADVLKSTNDAIEAMSLMEGHLLQLISALKHAYEASSPPLRDTYYHLHSEAERLYSRHLHPEDLLPALNDLVKELP